MTKNKFTFSLPRLVFGLAVIIFGIALTLDNLELVGADDLIPYWPLGLVAVGLASALNRTYSSLAFAAVMVGFGAWLLLFNLHYVHEAPWEYFWPLVLIAVGVNLLLGGFRRRRRRTGDRDYTTAFAFMSGQELKNSSADFQGADLTAIMGGCELDLRQARIEDSVPVVRVFAFWGGIDVKVPPDWRVESRTLPLMGAFVDNSEAPATDGPVVMIKGAAIMGGVEINN